MSKQVLEIEQMQRLKELGINTSKAGMAFIGKFADSEVLIELPDTETCQSCHEGCGIFTLQDVLDLLPGMIVLNNSKRVDELWLEFGTNGRHNELWYVKYRSLDGYTHKYTEKINLIDAAYEMLCWCAENKFIPTN